MENGDNARPATDKEKIRKRPNWKKRLQRWLILTLAPPIAERWMRWFDYTALKDNQKLLTLLGHEELVKRVSAHQEPTILCLWHNRLAFGPTAYQYCKGKGAYIMVSRSFDGDLISKTIGRFKNLHAVRGGSSSKPGQDKGGKEALAEMIEICKQGWDMTITPDGPQGPVYQAKRGIIDLAAATGIPIFPVSANADRVFVAKSWDKTRVPFPYARFVYKVGPAITVPPDADEETIEKKRQELEKVLVELTEFVDAFYK